MTLGQVYTLEVQVDGNGSSDIAEVRIKVIITPPIAPTSLMAVAASSTQIDLFWTASAEGGSVLTGYTMQYNKTGETAFGESITDIVADATSYSHVSLDAGAEYTYRLVAINDVGDSDPSNEISATTHDVPVAPTSLTAIAVSDTEIDLSWDCVQRWKHWTYGLHFAVQQDWRDCLWGKYHRHRSRCYELLAHELGCGYRVHLSFSCN